MAKRRKTYLLYKDHTVSWSKKPLQAIIDQDFHKMVQWVLIPIYQTGYTYIAVAGDAFLGSTFDHATIRLHMQYRLVSHQGKTLGPSERVWYDYYTTTMEVEQLEDFYQALYNVMAFRYMQEISGCTDNIDEMWYMAVEDIAIKLYDEKGKKYDSFEYSLHTGEDDDVPFNYDRFLSLCNELSDHFMLGKIVSGMQAPNMVLEKTREGDIIWKASKQNIDMRSSLHRVCIANWDTGGYTILKPDDYDQLLRLSKGEVFITPISLLDDPCRYSALPVAYDFNLPKYSFDRYNDPDSSEVHEHYGPQVYGVLTMSIFEAESIIVFLDNFHFVYRVYHEGTKVAVAHMADRDDLENLAHHCTTLIECFFDLESNDGHPSDRQFIIRTDPYEDNPVSLKEVIQLLKLEAR